MQRSSDGNPGDSKAFAARQAAGRVLYVHGLLVRGREAWGLRYRLRRDGLPVVRFRYDSRAEPPERVAARLAAILRDAPDLHLVGHSLGGLITLAALAEAGAAWRGRAVLMGSPFAGSGCARRVGQLPGGRRVLGAARDWLCAGLDGAAAAPLDRVATVAGTFNHGVGTLLQACPPPGDGVVSVEETRLDGTVARLQVNTTHLGLLFSRRVAGAVSGFLRSGAFPSPDAPESADMPGAG